MEKTHSTIEKNNFPPHYPAPQSPQPSFTISFDGTFVLIFLDTAELDGSKPLHMHAQHCRPRPLCCTLSYILKAFTKVCIIQLTLSRKLLFRYISCLLIRNNFYEKFTWSEVRVSFTFSASSGVFCSCSPFFLYIIGERFDVPHRKISPCLESKRKMHFTWIALAGQSHLVV